MSPFDLKLLASPAQACFPHFDRHSEVDSHHSVSPSAFPLQNDFLVLSFLLTIIRLSLFTIAKAQAVCKILTGQSYSNRYHGGLHQLHTSSLHGARSEAVHALTSCRIWHRRLCMREVRQQGLRKVGIPRRRERQALHRQVWQV